MKNKYRVIDDTTVAIEVKGQGDLLIHPDRLLAFQTFNLWRKGVRGYPGAKFTDETGKRREVTAHRLAMGLDFSDPRQVDHIDGNLLDCRPQALRVVTLQENVQNRIRLWKIRPSRSGYRLPIGVFEQQPNRFTAMLVADYKLHYLGIYDHPANAFAAMLAAKRELHPSAPEEFYIRANAVLAELRTTYIQSLEIVSPLHQ